MPIEFKTEEERNPTTPTIVEENLTQIAYTEGEEGQLAIEFLEENGLYSKFLLWQGIKEQLKKLKEDLAS
jgi:hypothetical protein